MVKVTIYHNPRCSKSRQALKLLQDNNIEHEVVEYLKNPYTQEQLKRILVQLNMQAGDIIRDAGGLAEGLCEEELIELMASRPEFVQRPIIVKGDKAVIGRPPENVLLLCA